VTHTHALTRTHARARTHTIGKTPLDKGSVSRRDRHLWHRRYSNPQY